MWERDGTGRVGGQCGSSTNSLLVVVLVGIVMTGTTNVTVHYRRSSAGTNSDAQYASDRSGRSDYNNQLI